MNRKIESAFDEAIDRNDWDAENYEEYIDNHNYDKRKNRNERKRSLAYDMDLSDSEQLTL